GVEGAWGGGEVQGGCVPGHVGAAGGVDGDAIALVKEGPAQEGGVNEGRIDHERPARIVRGDVKADLMWPCEHVGARDFPAGAVDLLVDERRPPGNPG